MVTPRSRSSFCLSMKKANAKEPLPKRSASAFSFSKSRSGRPPSSKIKRPVVVLLPLSTWPQITMERRGFSELAGIVNTSSTQVFRTQNYWAADVANRFTTKKMKENQQSGKKTIDTFSTRTCGLGVRVVQCRHVLFCQECSDMA